MTVSLLSGATGQEGSGGGRGGGGDTDAKGRDKVQIPLSKHPSGETSRPCVNSSATGKDRCGRGR